MTTLLIVLLVLLLVGAFPAYGVRDRYGYGPTGLIGLLIVVVLILLILGRI